MYPSKTMIDVQETLSSPAPADLKELVDESALKLVLLADKKFDDYYTIKNLLASLVVIVDSNLNKEDCYQCLQKFFIMKKEFVIYSTKHQLQEELNQFYCKNIVMSEKKIFKLSCLTVNQSQCEEWYQARRFRLLASSNIHCIKIRIRKTIDKLVNDILYPSNVNNECTNYGLTHENKAKEKYQDLNGCEVKKVDVIVSDKQPWLCASIDGVVMKNGCVVKLVEFKCPMKCKDQPVVDWERKSCNVKYLYFEGYNIQLKKSINILLRYKYNCT